VVSKGLVHILESGLKVRRSELARAGLMFVYQLTLVSAFLVSRTVRDALFLSRYQVEKLPLMYVAVAISVSLASMVWARVSDRWRRDIAISRTLLASALVLTGAWALLAAKVAGDWLYPALYVFVEIFGAISTIQFWIYANDIFSSREAKRLFPIIGAGGVVGSVICGFAVGGAARGVGAEMLVLSAAMLLCFSTFIVSRIRRLVANDVMPVTKANARIERALARRGVLANRHLRLIAGVVCLTMIASTIVDYQFKVIARDSFHGDENGLAAYFGYFYGFAGLVSCTVQLFAVGRLLERAGIAIALLVLPLGLLTGTSAILLPAIPLLWAATLAKGADAAFRYTVNDATMQLLYVPVATRMRARAKALIDGMVKPISVGISGLAILAMTKWLGAIGVDAAHDLAWLDLALIGSWIGLVLGIRKEYVRSLIGTLRTRRLDFDAPFAVTADEATLSVLRSAISSPDETEVLHALELLPSVTADFSTDVAGAVMHSSPEVRIRCLETLGRSGKFGHLEAIRSRFADVDARVRAAAVRAFCALGRERTFREASGFLKDRSPIVRGAAVAGLFEHGGLDGVLIAAETLKTLLASEDPIARIEGARVLEDAKVRNFYAPILVLLQDPVLEVRLAAIRAAGALAADALAPALVYQLAAPRTARSAAAALAVYGPSVEPVLVKVLGHRRESPAIRRQIPRILAKVGEVASMRALTEALDDPELPLVAECAKAIARLREKHPALTIDDAHIARSMKREICSAFQALATLLDLGVDESTLIGEALALRHERHLAVAFRLLSIRYPTRTIELVYLNLESDNKSMRSNAVELVDNLLPREESRLVLPLLEAHSNEERVKAGMDLFPLERRTAHEWLESLASDPDPWVATTAIHHLAQSGRLASLAASLDRSSAWDPLVLETTCHALTQGWESGGHHVPREQALALATLAMMDELPAMKSAGEALKARLGAG